ncbi:hypothetical protein AXG93_242s1310 [Marchantia polymorpha subsp. ruderalis]|uniref:Structural maintenance of chromosomes protein n=1 Tax=Marchantia polymorpha subsp. ruderalis TaxID=1480154 RepID=A0A176VLV7_MARPO|nr:hypothetical protein AXG93_242s1310 [Marchantia polymorpha subsp. ruderalis]
MFIKQVIIEGFKSYKEQVATEPFSSRHNCVVGANGSGKTNFFHAIRFVLSDLFHNLRAEDRQALLHEGAGNQVMSAFVEIVFDNSDNRMPVDREEVRLRRTIGLKKDEYFLDKKHITKTEVMNLLESAGFSRSNPYYVVQQGKIASLTLMKDSERLDLLKEIGGTRVYEERRKESLKIMQDTENRRKQIIEVVQYIEERLKELDEEKEELRKYQQLDKQRRSLEYTIFEKELLDARQKLEEIEDARAKVSEKSTNMHNTVLDSHEQLKTFEKELKTLSKDLQGSMKEKEVAERQKTEALKTYAKVELDVRDVEDRIRLEAKTKDEVFRELKALEKDIQRSKSDLEQVNPEYEKLLAQEEEIIKGISDREKQLSILYQKQGRTTQFANKLARDKWLKKEIADSERVMASISEQPMEFYSVLVDVISRSQSRCSYLGFANNFDYTHLFLGSFHGFTDYGLWVPIQLQIQVSSLQTVEWVETLEEEIRKLNEEHQQQSKNVEIRMSDLQQQEGQVGKCAEDFGILKARRDDLQEMRKSLWKQENDLMSEVEKLKMDLGKAEKSLDHAAPGDIRRGLNSIKRICKDHDIRGVHGPICELLDCDEKFYTAVEVTAGTSLFHVVVDHDDISTRIIRYLSSQKGGRVTFMPLNRIRAPDVRYPAGPDVVPLLKKLNYAQPFHGAFAQTDQLITNVVSEQQKLDAQQVHLKSEADQLRSDIANTKKSQASTVKALEKKHLLLGRAHSQIENLKNGIAMRYGEMGTDLIDQLTDEERRQLHCLNPEITQLKEELINFKTARMEAETRKSELETLLSTNLVRRQQELEAHYASIDPQAMSTQFEMKRQELSDAKAAVDEANGQLKFTTDQIEKYNKKIRELKNSRDEIKALEDNYERTLQDEAKDLEQLLNRRNLLQVKREDLMKKIRDLGSLPSDAFEKYQKKNLKELHKMLHKCNEQLKKFSHVNKKALDQYVNFTEQREELHQRQAELDSGDEKIRELISVLDQRKDESIERTFKGVAKNFREAFSELVQGGHGSLVMMKKRKADEAEDEDADGYENHDGDGEGRVEKYVGVKVKVSFTGQGETQSMKQLSGGQKTVVALTLIFAIQRCDPAPFYLFDEIDAALDPQYRTAVGNMIKRQADSDTTQFITTTFRPELVKVADRVYGVTHKNRVSRVDVIRREDALTFIEQDQSHQNE